MLKAVSSQLSAISYMDYPLSRVMTTKNNVMPGLRRASTGAGEACLSPTEKSRFEPFDL
jgi:hypothetical protein